MRKTETNVISWSHLALVEDEHLKAAALGQYLPFFRANDGRQSFTHLFLKFTDELCLPLTCSSYFRGQMPHMIHLVGIMKEMPTFLGIHLWPLA